ncbi:LytR family transcriptional regulator [uncultured Psychrobacillus sp.]|uniref:LCP family glycopolymer transferase n=1 Tax=uncultured Psychrobacillus sp. TaxID=1551585 RepID=UPI00261EB145|nr:LytR family transcriptional regulator [uncultured Psychrobacillus sp.]
MKNKRKIWSWILGISGILVVGTVLLGYFLYKDVTDTVKDMHEPIDRKVSEKRTEPITFKEKDPFSVLVLGVDERDNDKGRSDTMIVMIVNPLTNTTTMVSIPRDTYTEIVGKGIQDKINHAYAFGGIEMSMATAENLLDIPIDYVVQVNMESFQDIVDAVGGITVNNDIDFAAGGHTFSKGELSLDGEEALSFIRMRYEDPRGDFGRQDRQKQVIQGVLKQGASVGSIMNYKTIFAALGKNIRTNLTFDEMVSIQSNYRGAVGNVNQLYIQNGKGKMIDGVWYYMMDDNELNTIQASLKSELAMK